MIWKDLAHSAGHGWVGEVNGKREGNVAGNGKIVY